MTAASQPNTGNNLSGEQAYDDVGHQVASVRLKNVTTDTSVTPNVVVGDLSVRAGLQVAGADVSTTNPIATNQVVGTPIYATTTGASGASANISLAGTSGKTTYINGFYVSVAHTSSGTIAGQVTLSLDGGTTTHMNFLIAVSTTYPGLISATFPDPIPATAQNTAIKITLPALSGGGVSSLSAFGYQL